MSQQNNNADDIKRKAQARLQSSCKKPSEYEDIADMFSKAGNLYKMNKQYLEASECWEQASQLNHAAKNNFESANCLKEAAKCMKNANRLIEYVHYLKQSASIMSDEGHFNVAANTYKEAAETMFQSGDYEKAVELYTLAVDLMSIDSTKITYLSTLAKLADCFAFLENYEQAYQTYEQVANGYLGKNSASSNYTAVEYLFKAGLTALCYDLITAKKAIEKYDTDLATFSSSRQGKLLHEVAEAYEHMDETKFMEAVKLNEGSIDNLQTKLLLRIKKEIQSQDELM